MQVVITDDALFGDDETPGQVPGYGTVPAGWVRDLLNPQHTDDESDADERDTDETGPSEKAATNATHAATTSTRAGDTAGAAASTSRTALREHARVWIRRLYTHPTTGQLVGMDSTRRVFDGGLRRFLLARDGGTCRTPWCDAPIRHLDHITDHARGGPTTATNGQGLCVRCNRTKQLPGFTARTIEPDGRRPGTAHTVEVSTPTGHTYRSTAPPLIPHPRNGPPEETRHHPHRHGARRRPTPQLLRDLPHHPARRLNQRRKLGPECSFVPDQACSR